MHNDNEESRGHMLSTLGYMGLLLSDFLSPTDCLFFLLFFVGQSKNGKYCSAFPLCISVQ